MPTQEILNALHEEILSTTRLPMAIQFLATELKHTGLLSSGFAGCRTTSRRFRPSSSSQTEDERKRFSIDVGLSILEREAQYRAGTPTRRGCSSTSSRRLSRNRLGYDEGLACHGRRSVLRRRLAGVHRHGAPPGRRRRLRRPGLSALGTLRARPAPPDPDYVPPVAPLFGEKEGKIAKANRGRDPLYLFAALQRQLGYPEVPRLKAAATTSTAKLEVLRAKIKELETRLKLVEGEVRGQVDLSEFMAKPELLQQPDDDEK